MASKAILINLDLNHNQIQNVLLQLQASGVVPSNVQEGQIWYDLGSKLVYFYDGSQAIPVGYLPPATTDTLGGVKIGENVQVTSDGTISILNASNAQKGVIRIATDNEAEAGTAVNIAINPLQLKNAINTALASALVYKGVWTIAGASTTAYPVTMLPAKKGDMYFVNGTGPSTVDGVEWNPGDYLVFNQNVASGTTITSAMVDKIDSTESSDIVRLDTVQTLTNKTIDADHNTISNLETDNFKSGVIVTEIGTIGTDTSIPTEQAVREALTTLDNAKQDKVNAAVQNNIATWDNAGNTKDSGKAFTTTVSTAATASDNKVPTELAVRTAISNAESATKFTATNPELTPVGGVCTWTITKPNNKDVDLTKAIVAIKETDSKEEVICNIIYTSATQLTIKMNRAATVTEGFYTAIVLG